jgi:hypothetical protein
MTNEKSTRSRLALNCTSKNSLVPRYSLYVSNRFHKEEQKSQLTTNSTIPSICILSTDRRYSNACGYYRGLNLNLEVGTRYFVRVKRQLLTLKCVAPCEEQRKGVRMSRFRGNSDEFLKVKAGN